MTYTYPTYRKIKFLDLSEEDMLKSKAFQYLYNFFIPKHKHNIAVCRAIGFAKAISKYDPKRGYGSVHFSELPQEGQIKQLCTDGVLTITMPWSQVLKRCYRYYISSITCDTFFQLLIEDGLIISQTIDSDKYVEVINPDREPVRIVPNPNNLEAERWINANRGFGQLDPSECGSHLLFYPVYHTDARYPGRHYELRAHSYQTLPNSIKTHLHFEDQKNMDISRAHITVAIELAPEIAPAFEFPGYEKKGGLAILNGMSAKKAQLEMPNAAMSDILNLKAACKALGKKAGLSCNKLWQYFHKREQEMIKQVTDYLDELKVGYLNMHDGLLVDKEVDFSPLGLQFGWIEKPLT
jgi:hypothetical protein